MASANPIAYFTMILYSTKFKGKGNAKIIKMRLEEPSSDRGRLFALREDGDGISRGISPVISERCRVVLKPVKARRAFVYKYIVAPLITPVGVGILIGIRQLIDRFVG